MNKIIVGTLLALGMIFAVGLVQNAKAQGANCVTPSMIEEHLTHKEFKKYSDPDSITAVRAYVLKILSEALDRQVHDDEITTFDTVDIFLSPDGSASMLVGFKDGCMVARQQLPGTEYEKIKTFVIGVSD